MSSQRKHVQSFFDQLAPAYRRRYEGKNAFLTYLHRERIEEALEGLDLTDKTVLDIGAGTGILYDRLAGADYYACDISEAMLAQSAIPPARRWVGAPQECDFPIVHFDAIFLLGVTTYLSKEELRDLLDWIGDHLAPRGRAVLSYSNGSSPDFRLRSWVAPLLPKRMLRKTVLGQDFAFRGYAPAEIPALLPGSLAIEKYVWLNATVFPFNRLFPRFSVWLSRWLLAWPLPDRLARRFCADYLVVLRSKRSS
jgi:SAM-dependent methyltransferase